MDATFTVFPKNKKIARLFLYFLLWLAPFGCLCYFHSFLLSSGPFYLSSFIANPGIELTPKDHGSDCKSLTFTTRPGSFPDRLLLLADTSITCISVTKRCVSFASENLRHLRMLDDLEKPGWTGGINYSASLRLRQTRTKKDHSIEPRNGQCKINEGKQ